MSLRMFEVNLLKQVGRIIEGFDQRDTQISRVRDYLPCSQSEAERLVKLYHETK
jgi:hypothetical protein